MNDLPHSACGGNDFTCYRQFPIEENQRARFLQYLASYLDNFAQLDGSHELHVELNRALTAVRGMASCGCSHGTVCKGHQHSTLNEASPVLVFALSVKAIAERIFVARLDGTDKTYESIVLKNRPSH